MEPQKKSDKFLGNNAASINIKRQEFLQIFF